MALSDTLPGPARTGLAVLMSPRSVAVVGASLDPASIGHALLRNILDGGFQGPVYPVHPRATHILGLPAYPTVEAIPAQVDLAVIAVPAAHVVAVAEGCGRKGVRGLVVISAGFRETDAAGVAREAALRGIVARHGMRLVGPNCLGIINNAPGVRLRATFGPRPLLPGTTALVTQSGAVGIALMEHAARVGLGLARFVSLGNKADVSGNDLLELWEDDPEVRQVLFYLENFGNPRNFVRIARRITRSKPIVVVKSGRTERGARAAGSHTGALMQSDALVDALLAQCGVLRAQTVEEMFDVATALATQPPLRGPRVGIVTNSGGPAILALDAFAGQGLVPADFGPATVARITPFLASASPPQNPLDLLAGGGPASFEACLRAVAADPGVDAVLAIWTPLAAKETAQAEAIARALRGAPHKPGIAVLFGHGPGTPAFEVLRRAGVPTYTFPENAVRSLGALRAVGAWQAQADEPPADLGVDRPAAQAILDQANLLPGGWLAMRDALGLLSAYGIQVPRHLWVESEETAAAAAKALGGPVVLKVEASGLVHKTEAGAVRLGLATPAEAARAFREAMQAVRDHGHAPLGALVMATVPPAPEILVGATQDPLFGPMVACGAGGIYTEVLQDVQFRLAPMARREAERMVGRLRVAPLLAGVRGAPAADVPALHGVVLRMARLAADFPQIQEVEANPVRVLPRGAGAVALDARVRLAPPEAPRVTRTSAPATPRQRPPTG